MWRERRDRPTSRLLLLAGLAAVAAACTSPERTLEAERTVNGLTADLGVVPAALVRGHEPGTATEMHRGGADIALSHHVMVALFEAASGRRVTEARVTATVPAPDGKPVTRSLEPMTVAGATTFGNYFAIGLDGRIVPIDVEVEFQGHGKTRFEFAYGHVP
jgi:hypothetical protein